LKPRDRFRGGSFKMTGRLYGSLKAVDPTTGETKATMKLPFPAYSGALATGGNLVFAGLLVSLVAGVVAALDAERPALSGAAAPARGLCLRRVALGRAAVGRPARNLDGELGES